MATIIKTPSGSYKAIIRKRGRTLKTKTFTRKTAARTWAARIEADAETMEALGRIGAGMSLPELAKQYLAAWTGKDTDRRRCVAFWTDRFGARKLTDIGPDLIIRELDGYSDSGVKPATVNRQKSVLSSMFRFAISKRYLLRNPCHGIPNLRADNLMIRYLDQDERTRLLEACRKSEWNKLYLLVLLALTTGARRGELLGLRWSNIDFNSKTAILADTKNGRPRILTIPSPAMKELHKHREIGGGLIFPSPKKPGQPMVFKKHWEQALREAGIENFRFHDLRHDFCSTLAMNGATGPEIAECAGHRSTQTTARYTHLSVSHRAKLTERIFGDG